MFPVCGDAQSSLNYGDREQNHPGANATAAAAPPVMKPSKNNPQSTKIGVGKHGVGRCLQSNLKIREIPD